MSLANIQPAIRTFLTAVQTRDHAALLASIDPDATLVDEGQDYRRDEIVGWLMAMPPHRTTSQRTINDARRAGHTVISVLTDEPQDSGNVTEILRDWHFRTLADRIATVRIERCAMPLMPRVVAAFVRATNRFNLNDLLATFVDDALVNDQLCDYWGRQAICEWAKREVIGPRVTMYVVGCVEHHGQMIVTAHINGDFDRRGLPDPLVLTFYFALSGDRIAQLIILRNQGAD